MHIETSAAHTCIRICSTKRKNDRILKEKRKKKVSDSNSNKKDIGRHLLHFLALVCLNGIYMWTSVKAMHGKSALFERQLNTYSLFIVLYFDFFSVVFFCVCVCAAAASFLSSIIHIIFSFKFYFIFSPFIRYSVHCVHFVCGVSTDIHWCS